MHSEQIRASKWACCASSSGPLHTLHSGLGDVMAIDVQYSMEFCSRFILGLIESAHDDEYETFGRGCRAVGQLGCHVVLWNCRCDCGNVSWYRYCRCNCGWAGFSLLSRVLYPQATVVGFAEFGVFRDDLARGF